MGLLSYCVGMILFVIGTILLWRGWWVPLQAAVSRRTALIRFTILWILGTSSVCVWRGLWYMEDYFIATRSSLEASQTASWIALATSIIGALVLHGGSSLMSPPTVFVLDGPSRLPPPICVTLLSSYYSLSLKASESPPEHHMCVYGLDLFLSFGILPMFVVFTWRNIWYLLDRYLWLAFTDPRALEFSLAYGILVSVVEEEANGVYVVASNHFQSFRKLLSSSSRAS